MKTTKKKAKIEYDDVEISEKEFTHAKIRITTMVDAKILHAIRAKAKKQGKKYQTLIKDILRSYIVENELSPRRKSRKVTKRVK